MLLLQIERLKIIFENPTFKAVDDISFSIDEGETLGIVGESGSGKSLTGLAIMGLLPINATVEGNIIFNTSSMKENLILLDEKQKQGYRGKEISMVFQEPLTSLNPVLTCGKQVEEMLILHTDLNKSDRKSKVLELFEEVMLPNVQEVYFKYPHQLSGGQRQRIVIAMAIACNPRLIIADEPTTALDVRVQEDILKLLKRLQLKYQVAIIFISHDLTVISKISDKILVLKQGNQVEYGTKNEVIHNPKAPYTKGLLACKPKQNERLKKMPVIEDFIKNEVKLESQSYEERKAFHNKIYSKAPILEIKNLNTYFSSKNRLFGKKDFGFHALKNIQIEIWKGETVGLVGESGSGKTTLGRSIMKLVENNSGNIIYKGRSINTLSKAETFGFRKNVQLVFQDPFSSLSPNQTIGDQIIEPILVHNLYPNSAKRKEKVFELMELTGLSRDWYHKFPHQLSGGQRQRVVIARALALEPELLICDESVSALDVSIQAQVINLLNDIKTRLELTYIFISHDLAIVRYMSDRIFVMKNGEIIEQGDADDICKNPQNRYTKVLLKAAFD